MRGGIISLPHERVICQWLTQKLNSALAFGAAIHFLFPSCRKLNDIDLYVPDPAPLYRFLLLNHIPFTVLNGCCDLRAKIVYEGKLVKFSLLGKEVEAMVGWNRITTPYGLVETHPSLFPQLTEILKTPEGIRVRIMKKQWLLKYKLVLNRSFEGKQDEKDAYLLLNLISSDLIKG